jgi:hypothetical protein
MRSEGDRSLADTLIGSFVSAQPQHLLRAVDRFLAPAAAATTVAGVAWTVTNLNGSVQSAEHASASASAQVFQTGGGIVTVRGPVIFGVHTPGGAGAPPSASLLQAAMDLFVAPDFSVDLAADGPFSFSRFDRATAAGGAAGGGAGAHDAAFRPRPVSELVSMKFRKRSATVEQLLPQRREAFKYGDSTAAHHQQHHRDPAAAASFSSPGAASTAATNDEHNNSSGAASTSSTRFYLYHARRDVVIMFRCQTPEDMLSLRRAIAAGLVQAQRDHQLTLPRPSQNEGADGQQQQTATASNSGGGGGGIVRGVHLDLQHAPQTGTIAATLAQRLETETVQMRERNHGRPTLRMSTLVAKGHLFGKQLPFGAAPSMSLFGGLVRVDAAKLSKNPNGSHARTVVWANNFNGNGSGSKASVAATLLSRLPGFPVQCQLFSTQGGDNDNDGQEASAATTTTICFTVPDSIHSGAVAAAVGGGAIGEHGDVECISLYELADFAKQSSSSAAAAAAAAQQQQQQQQQRSSSLSSGLLPPSVSAFSIACTKTLMAQLALAISLAHRRGVVVGPMTPARIFHFLYEQRSTLFDGGDDDVKSPASMGGGGGNDPLPPIFATIVGAGEAPAAKVWALLRCSPSLLPFVPPWVLRDSVMQLACAERDGKPVTADVWTQGDDFASLGCLLFWLRTGRPVHAEKNCFRVSSTSATSATVVPNANASSSNSAAHQLAAHIERLQEHGKYSLSNWHSVLSRFASAGSHTEWNSRIYRNLVQSLQEGAITALERSLLLRLLQLPDAGTSSFSSSAQPQYEFVSQMYAAATAAAAAGGGGGSTSAPGSRSSSRNNTPRTCRNTEAASATDVLLHPYFAHVNFIDVFERADVAAVFL